jgi:hypothetical protein
MSSGVIVILTRGRWAASLGTAIVPQPRCEPINAGLIRTNGRSKVGRLSMRTCVHFSRSLPSNSWWQTMADRWQALSRPSAAEGGGRRPAFSGLATQPYSATEVDGWQHKLSRVSQNRAAVHTVSPLA